MAFLETGRRMIYCLRCFLGSSYGSLAFPTPILHMHKSIRWMVVSVACKAIREFDKFYPLSVLISVFCVSVLFVSSFSHFM